MLRLPDKAPKAYGIMLLRHSRIAALSFAILVDSAVFRFTVSITGGVQLRLLPRFLLQRTAHSADTGYCVIGEACIVI